MENYPRSLTDKYWKRSDTNGGLIPGNPRLIVNHVIYKYIQHLVIMYTCMVKSLIC